MNTAPRDDRVDTNTGGLSRRAVFELDGLLAMGLCLLFYGTGFAKWLVNIEFFVSTFGPWDAAPWALHAIGALEVLAGTLVLIPNTRARGGALIAALMASAAVYHIARGEVGLLVIPLVVLAVDVVFLRLRLRLDAEDEIPFKEGAELARS